MRSTMQRWAVGVLALGMGLGVGTARGTVILSTEWIGTPGQSGDWFDPANWQGGGVPRPGTYATISNGGEAVISGGEAKAGRVELLGETAGQWNLSLTGGSLTIDGQFSGIFMGQQAGLRVSGGILRADRILAGVRGDANNRVRIEQDGGVIELSGGLLVNGEPTPDFVTIFPATNQSTELTVAEPLLPTPRGRYDLTGGRVSTQWSTIGSTGYAVMKQTGGTHEVAGSLTIGGGMLPMFTWDRPKELPGKPVGGILLPPTYYTQGVSPSVVEGAPVLIGPIDATPLNTSRGAYQIEGGLLKTGRIEVKNSGSLDQSGGRITTDYLSIDAMGWYRKTGGTLTVAHGIQLDGGMVLRSGVAVEAGSGLFNFSRGTVIGAEHLSLDLGNETLLILSAEQLQGPWGATAAATSRGLVHIAGSDLTIDSGRKVTDAGGKISDYVTVRGTLTAGTGGKVDLESGVKVEGGTVDLGAGTITTTDTRSGISGGSLKAEELSLLGWWDWTGPVTQVYPWYPLYRPALFAQTGGSVEISQTLSVGAAQYLLMDGSLKTQATQVQGQSPLSKASFLQTGGTHETGTLTIGRTHRLDLPYETSGGRPDTYVMAGGVLKSGKIGVGNMVTYDPVGQYVLEDQGDFYLPAFVQTFSWDASLVVQGGTVMTDYLEVGPKLRENENPYEHTLAITSNKAAVRVNKSISFGASAVFTAVPGTTITITDGTTEPFHMASTVRGNNDVAVDFINVWPSSPVIAFDNRSRNPQAMSGLENLRLVFVGVNTTKRPDVYAYLEVAGEDQGFTVGGFEDNFALDTLVIGDGRAARVMLIDAFDNQTDSTLPEALYVEHLVLAPGSVLDLHGLHIYYKTLSLGEGAMIVGEVYASVPEPGSVMGLVVMGLLTLLRRRAKGIRA